MNVYSLYEGLFVRVDRGSVYKVVNAQPIYQSSLTSQQWTSGNVGVGGVNVSPVYHGKTYPVIELTKQEVSDKGLADFGWPKYAGQLIRINSEKVYRVLPDGSSGRYQMQLSDDEWSQVVKAYDVGSMTLKQKLFSDDYMEAAIGEKAYKTTRAVGMGVGGALVGAGILGAAGVLGAGGGLVGKAKKLAEDEAVKGIAADANQLEKANDVLKFNPDDYQDTGDMTFSDDTDQSLFKKMLDGGNGLIKKMSNLAGQRSPQGVSTAGVSSSSGGGIGIILLAIALFFLFSGGRKS